MLLDDNDAELLKIWLIKKLESVADADSDVLADYVLALVKTDDAGTVAKDNIIEQLKDFLLDDAIGFVDELFNVIATKSYDPSKPPPKITAPTYKPPQRTSHALPEALHPGKKRGYHDWDRDESQYGKSAGDRPMKQARRGGRGGRGQHHHGSSREQTGFSDMPNSTPSMFPFDPNDPVASLFAMQQAMGMLPGFPPPSSNGSGAPRCPDYDTKGYCASGAMCPFQHGNDPYIVSGNEYDPAQATLLNVQPSRTGIVHTSPRGKCGRRGNKGSNNWRGGGKRPDFAHLGQNDDPSVTSIVVESIPEDKFDEQAVRDFFQQFGNVEEITMQPYKRIAVVKYDTHEAARAAYNSPKVVFDNRFVKVYWYKSDNPKILNGQSVPDGDAEMEDQELEIDYKEVAKKQEEAQRKYEERKKKIEEVESRQKAIEELEAKRQQALAEIARKTKKPTPTSAMSTPGKEDSENVKAMKAQLAKLEAEAIQLGIDPEAASNACYEGGFHSYPYRGRGGFRGRPRGRGGYNPSFRGGWSGARGGAVMRLDNRPKTVCLIFKEGTYEDHQEDVRQVLLFSGMEMATLTKHPDRANAALVAFPERYLAEQFMASTSSPGSSLAGKCELSWYNPDAPAKNVVSEADLKMVISDDEPGRLDSSPGREDDSDRDDRWDEL